MEFFWKIIFIFSDTYILKRLSQPCHSGFVFFFISIVPRERPEVKTRGFESISIYSTYNTYSVFTECQILPILPLISGLFLICYGCHFCGVWLSLLWGMVVTFVGYSCHFCGVAMPPTKVATMINLKIKFYPFNLPAIFIFFKVAYIVLCSP